MTFVIRRLKPNARGGRYFAKPHPVVGSLSGARRFETQEAAEAERVELRESWLWEVLDEQEATHRDAEEARAFASKMQPTPAGRRSLRLFHALALTASGIALPPGRTS